MVFQISFDQPYALWLFFTVPLLVFSHLYFMHHAKKKAIRFGNFHTIERVTGKRILTKNILLLVVRIFILSLLILAAAGTTIWRDVEQNENDIVFLIDSSASMTASDMDGTRLDAAKQTANTIVDLLTYSTKIGVVQFSGLAQVQQMPTTDSTLVKNAVNSITILTAGGTDVSGGIYTAVNLLANSEKGKAVVLITDGVTSVSLFEENPLPKAIAYAQKNHVIIHTIGIGTQQGTFLPGIDARVAEFDEQNLQEIAAGTGGTYSWARSPDQLAIARENLIKSAGVAIVPTPLIFVFLLSAIIVVLFEWGLSNTRFRILP